MNPEDIQLTIEDLNNLNEVIQERHSDNPSLCLRFNSVFKQLSNSLGGYKGGSFQKEISGFVPTPLTKINGKEIKERVSTKLDLKPIQVDEVDAFRNKIQSIYDSFLNRETTDLLDSLEPIEIRGVAKLAGVEDFDKVPVDGQLVEGIKKTITAKNDLAKEQADVKLKLVPDAKPVVTKK
jgi:hypothetical protein